MPITELVAAAAQGDRQAWEELVERFMPLVYSIVRRYRLPESDAQDVSQSVWLKLLEHLGNIREPRALPGWIATTTRNEAIGVFNAKHRTEPVDPSADWLMNIAPDGPGVDEGILRAERLQALRDAMMELPADQQRLLLLMVVDPPLSYGEISRTLGMPIGSIGPTRARSLNNLRATLPIRTLRESWSDIDGRKGVRK